VVFTLKKVTTLIIVVFIGVILWGMFREQAANPRTNTEIIESNIGVKVGNVVQDTEFNQIDGSKTRLSDYRGQAVMINFWATWCPPCKIEMPYMENITNKYKDFGCVVLTVNMTSTETSVNAVIQYVQKEGYSFPIIMDGEGDISNQFQILVSPTSYFIDKNGVIRKKIQGATTEETMLKMLEQAALLS
jgi:peroxiredoxin